MPSWKFHISLAQKLNKNNDFILGNILPDIPNGYLFTPSTTVEKSLTHFKEKKEGRPPVINEKLFLKKYKNNLDNEIVQGYYLHLLTDKFFNEYFYKNHTKVINNNRKVILKNGKIYVGDKKPWTIKQEDFQNYENKLIIQNQAFNTTKETFNKLKEINFPITEEDMKKTTQIINNLSKTNKAKIETKIFTEEELDKLCNDCYEYLKEKLKEITE